MPRKSLGGGWDGPTTAVSVRLEPKHRKLLRALAERWKLTESEALRRCLLDTAEAALPEKPRVDASVLLHRMRNEAGPVSKPDKRQRDRRKPVEAAGDEDAKVQAQAIVDGRPLRKSHVPRRKP